MEKVTQKWSFCQDLLSPHADMEGQEKFHSLQNISGASWQNIVAAFS